MSQSTIRQSPMAALISGLSTEQLFGLSLPLFIPLSMTVVFTSLSVWLGAKGGYFAGFLFYWLFWCSLVPVALIGWTGVCGLFKAGLRLTGGVRLINLALLLGPPAVGLGLVLPGAMASASAPVVAASLLLATVNATLEEVLWRGVFAKLFPSSIPLGWQWPSFGFAIWHIAPLAIFPNVRPGGTLSFVLAAGVLGLAWGWSVLKTGSLRGPALSHAIFDFSGLGARVYLG